jgi:hypothetical protein
MDRDGKGEIVLLAPSIDKSAPKLSELPRESLAAAPGVLAETHIERRKRNDFGAVLALWQRSTWLIVSRLSSQ